MYHTFAYTNHTVLPEALEKWPVSMIGKLLPRHMDLIYLINHYFIEKIKKRYPGDSDRIQRMSLIEEGGEKKVRMANLAIICSHTVNGVAALHTELLRATLFRDFDQMFPGKIQNKTNGVTPRRWIHCCNPSLSNLISETIGPLDEWMTNLTSLRELSAYSSEDQFVDQFIQVKLKYKRRLRDWVKTQTGVDIPVEGTLYDVQVKRIHEYKRQLMNILYVVYRYIQIKMTPKSRRQFVPRVVMIGGKAAPGYFNAKMIIKLINSVAQKVNAD